MLDPSDFTYVNVAGLTQFRLWFIVPSDGNNTADYATFYAGDAASAQRPTLTIEYTMP